ncbi:PREDICTED: potassium/sodium hyperpolarization-activated cyclic nucleotide-gated channel 2-like [Vollenhovia emeryi]|uniref:potassium/sodium hyperpolarization-activated cyclic nucleotide-gated channel 2-like n=1 Tax=Vollenhovia emeryi TaxID=411798 RepID=UPI0005F3E7E1|nr:PREDICTED: potassium/sodium hyperpolarization-activated cyclic nucleotide-gated channel 2-like [Vollenhovia emeryi]
MLRVEHECQVEPEPEDILFPPDRNFFRRTFDASRSLLMVSEKNPGARKYLRSRASVISEKRQHLRNYKHILHPFSAFRFSWDILMILAVTCLLLTVPYQAAFEIRKRLSHWTICKNVLLCLCCMDILVNFMTGYFDKMDQVVVMKPKKIMKRYIRYGTFLPDLLGSFPTDIAFVSAWRKDTVTRELVSLMCGFRVFSLNSYVTKIAQAYDVPVALYEVCVMPLWLMIAFQWQSCLYWLVPIATTSMQLPERPSNDSWIHEFNLWEESGGLRYLYSLLRAVSVFLSSGFLHRKPKNEADLTLVILLQLLGSLTILLLIARVNQLYKSANSSKIKYQDIMAQVKQYMKHRQLPYSTQRRIVAYYEFCFQHRYFCETEILNTLSPHIRQEIGMHVCRKLVENVTFFSNLPLSLLTRIVALLKSEIFLTNDVIVRANQPGDCMYFIATGTVAIYTSSGKEVCHLEDGAHFGEIALVMPDERRVASVVAVEICELYRLDRADFARTIHPYPMLREQIKKIAVERHERTTILNMH